MKIVQFLNKFLKKFYIIMYMVWKLLKKQWEGEKKGENENRRFSVSICRLWLRYDTWKFMRLGRLCIKLICVNYLAIAEEIKSNETNTYEMYMRWNIHDAWFYIPRFKQLYRMKERTNKAKYIYEQWRRSTWSSKQTIP